MTETKAFIPSVPVGGVAAIGLLVRDSELRRGKPGM